MAKVRNKKRDGEFQDESRAFKVDGSIDLDVLTSIVVEANGANPGFILEGDTLWVTNEVIGDAAIEKAISKYEPAEESAEPRGAAPDRRSDEEPKEGKLPDPEPVPDSIRVLIDKDDLTNDEMQEAVRFLLRPYRKAEP